MALEKLFKKILDDNNIPYIAVDLDGPQHDGAAPGHAGVPLQNNIKDILLKCEDDLCFALYPANRLFELDKLRKITGKHLQPADARTAESILQRYARHKLPPLNISPGLYVLIDEALGDRDTLLYQALEQGQGYILSTEDICHLASDEKIGVSFSSADESIDETVSQTQAMSLAERMKHLRELPPLPDTVNKLLGLRNRYEINADYLVSIIDKDPVLCAQIVSYANSAFFGHSGKVGNLKDAIFRVLGVNVVIDIALGLSLGKSLRIPAHGALGANRIWRHATYSAALMQKLAMQMPWGKRPDIGMAYLAGLLHDIGFFVLGYLFRKEYQSLSRLLEAHQDTLITHIEYNLMGITHCELGQMALRLWNLPEELITAARYHHDLNYEGEHAVYVLLLNLVEQLLSQQGLAYTRNSEISETLLAKLGLEEEVVILAADQVIQTGAALDQLAGQLCA